MSLCSLYEDPLEPMGPQGKIAQMDLCTREYLVLS